MPDRVHISSMKGAGLLQAPGFVGMCNAVGGAKPGAVSIGVGLGREAVGCGAPIPKHQTEGPNITHCGTSLAHPPSRLPALASPTCGA